MLGTYDLCCSQLRYKFKTTCLVVGYLATKEAIKASVEGLAIVFVNTTTFPPFALASSKLALTLVFTSAQVASLPAILGCFKRKLSYNERTEA